jgi:hypothetical protein
MLHSILFILKIYYLPLFSLILRVKYRFWSYPCHKPEANPSVWWCWYTVQTLTSAWGIVRQSRKILAFWRSQLQITLGRIPTLSETKLPKIHYFFLWGIGGDQTLTKFGFLSMCIQISHKTISKFNTYENEFEAMTICY